MSDYPNRREQILDLLTQEFRDRGHSVITEEGDIYVTVLVQRGPVTIPAAKFNLSTLANQIDRRIG